MKKIAAVLVFSILGLLATFFIVSCSVKAVGVTQQYSDLEIVRLAFNVIDYDTQNPIADARIDVNMHGESNSDSEIDPKRFTFFSGASGNELGMASYEQVIEDYLSNADILKYKIKASADGYANGYDIIGHTLTDHASGNVTVYTMRLALAPLGQAVQVPASGATMYVPQGDPNGVEIKIPSGANSNVYVRITPISLKSASGKIKPESGLIIPTDIFLHCEAGSMEGGKFVAKDHFVFADEGFDEATVDIAIPVSASMRDARDGVTFVYLNEVSSTWTGESVAATIDNSGDVPKLRASISHFSDMAPMHEANLTYTVSNPTSQRVQYINAENCNGDNSISYVWNKDEAITFPLGVVGESVSTSLLQALELTAGYEIPVTASIYVDPYEWRRFYVNRISKVYTGSYNDVDGNLVNFRVVNYDSYEVENVLVKCHDQGAGQ